MNKQKHLIIVYTVRKKKKKKKKKISDTILNYKYYITILEII